MASALRRHLPLAVGLLGVTALAAACGAPVEPAPLGVARAPLPTRAWIEIGGYPAELRVHTQTLLGTGEVLFTGANDSAAVYRFDPFTGQLRRSPDLLHARGEHVAVVLPSGRVLVVGGGPAETELYDPATDTWTAGPTTALVGRPHAAPLPGARVLLLAGQAAEIFDSASGTLTALAGMDTSAVQGAATAVSAAAALGDGRVAFVLGSRFQTFDPGANAGAGGFALGPTILGTADLGSQQSFGVDSLLAVPQGWLLAQGTDPCAYFFSLNCDPMVQRWNGDGTAPVELPIPSPPKRHAAAITPLGTVLTLGGDESWPQADVREFDPRTGTSAPLGPTRYARAWPQVTVLPTGAVMTSGRTGGAALGEPFEAFVEHGDWAAGPPLAAGRVRATATLTSDGRVWVVGGEGPCAEYGRGAALAGALPFEPGTGQWGTELTLAAARREHSATALGGDVLVVGGTDGTTPIATAERVGASGVTPAGALATARRGHAAVRLPGGDVLVAGGTGAAGALSSTERWSAATATFSPGPDLPAPEGALEAVLLHDGTVLLVGAASATRFDPASDTMTALVPPTARRTRPALALLDDGRVAITGADKDGEPQGWAELWDPATGALSGSVAYANPAPDLRPGVRLLGGDILYPGGARWVYASETFGWYGEGGVEVLQPRAQRGRGAFRSIAAPGPPLGGAAFARLLDGSVLVVGGGTGIQSVVAHDLCEIPTLATFVYQERVQVSRRPAVSAIPATVVAGTRVPLVASGLLRTGVVAGAAARSPVHAPVPLWLPLSGQGSARGRLENVTPSGADWVVPTTALHGPGLLHLVVDGIPSVGVPVEITPALAATSCAVGGECASGFCADGVCCDAACDQPCQACTAALKGAGADGVCGDVPAAQSGTDECFGGPGSACAADAECRADLSCVDGVCCDAPCQGQCEACDVDGSYGTCVAVVGAPHGARTACGADTVGEPCSARVCDGVERAACAAFVGPEVACRGAACAEGVGTFAATCAGSGACPAVATEQCAPYACDGARCGVAPCTTDAECAPAFRCAIAPGATQGDCAARTEFTCDGDHTLSAPDGTTQDCAPYRCQAAGCRTACSATPDCIEGFVCDPALGAGTCVKVERVTTTEDAGCGCRVPARGTAGRSTVAALLGALLVARRARRLRAVLRG